MDLLNDPRFEGVKPFEKRLWLSSPTMHGEEQFWVEEAFRLNWVSTLGENIHAVEELFVKLIGAPYGVALSSGTAALHLAIRLAGHRLYGRPRAGHGALEGRKVFASDMTFDATVNPILYEGGEPVFIDSEPGTWNMDPKALEKAFELYPEVRLVVVVHLYGIPCRMDEIRRVAEAHGAIIVEDAAESLGSTYRGKQTGCLGDIGAISFNGNKIITGSTGGMILLRDEEEAALVRKWATQAREKAPWYQHDELGYNYRMSNIVAGIVRGQLPHLPEQVAQKREVFERYRRGFEGLPLKMAPWEEGVSEPNRWLSCFIIDKEAMCPHRRSACNFSYEHVPGKSCPDEILSVLSACNAEGRPIWKPMHMQPLYAGNTFVTVAEKPVDEDVFDRGLCLPSDNKLSEKDQAGVIDIVRRCFS